MALIYGMFCGWVMVLRKLNTWKRNRRKTIYEAAILAFQNCEQECKNQEVVLGRPSDYHSQFRLMQLFFESENARQRWLQSEKQLTRHKHQVRKMRKLAGKKLPYTFGLLDMAFAFKLLDAGRQFGLIDIASTFYLLKNWFV